MTAMSLDVVETGSFANGDMRKTTDVIRIVSWNVARGSRLDEIIAFLDGANADLICLQETDRNARRTGHRNIAAEIARALRMNYVFAIEFQELSQGSPESPAYHGQATLSPFLLEDPRILRFRAQSRFWHPRWWTPPLALLQRRVGGRLALVCDLRIRTRRLTVYNLHLESRNDRTRRAQLSELLESSLRCDSQDAVLLAGDFNVDLSKRSAASVIEDVHFQNPLRHSGQQTTPSNHFGRKGPIDWIVVKGPLRPVAARVHDSVSASDHYPLSLTLNPL